MITKTKFVQTINSVIEYDRFLSEAMMTLRLDFYEVPAMADLENSLLSALCELVHDDKNIIETFLYNNLLGVYITRDDVPTPEATMPFVTVDDLWDVLVFNCPELGKEE